MHKETLETKMLIDKILPIKIHLHQKRRKQNVTPNKNSCVKISKSIAKLFPDVSTGYRRDIFSRDVYHSHMRASRADCLSRAASSRKLDLSSRGSHARDFARRLSLACVPRLATTSFARVGVCAFKRSRAHLQLRLTTARISQLAHDRVRAKLFWRLNPCR